MQVEAVCAVVVTFHPDAKILDRLAALAAQSGGLVVVDNGSSLFELEQLRPFLDHLPCRTLIEHGENLGIATALNAGVRWAQTHGFHAVALFDQDSQVTPGFMTAMTSCWTVSPWGARLGILVPTYQDVRLQVAIPSNRVREGLEAAMTSGSLLPVSLFARLGFFVDELFIDGVDYEFSLRVRASGLVIAECPQAMLEHRPGEPRVVRLGGRRLYQTANYSPTRRYYQERNKIWISRRYFGRFPVFCAKLFLFSAKDFVKILVAEQDAVTKARYFLRGMWDGLRERMGRLS